MAGVLITRWPCEDRDMEEECQVMMKAETGVTQLHVKECQRWPANYEKTRKEGFPYRFQRGHASANSLVSDFQPTEL